MSHTIADEIQIFGQGSSQVIIREDGYINATALCKSAGKLLGHYFANKVTKAFLDELSSVIGIPITTLVQVKQGGTPQEQGTWIHPDVAINLAQWISPKYAVLVAQTMRQFHEGKLQKPLLNKERALEAYDVFSFSFQVTKQIHHNHNQAVLTANIATKKVTGTDVLELTESTHLISAVQEQLLIPTEIGVRLGLSAHKVNSLLEEKGLLIRYRDDKGKIKKGTDELSEEGKQFGVYLDTSKKHSDGTPVRQIKWRSGVIGVLEQQLKAAA